MNVIKKKQIKYIKLFLISPWLDFFISIFYLLSLPILALLIIELKGNSLLFSSFSNYEISLKLRQTLDVNKFNNITSSEDFLNYLHFILDSTFQFRNNSEFPLFIPIGALRLKKYSIQNSICSNLICTDCNQVEVLKLSQSNPDCSSVYTQKNSRNKPSIATNSSESTYKLRVESNSKYSIYDSFVKNLDGKYSEYNLLKDGHYIDLDLNFYKENLNIIKEFINDKSIRFVVITVNFYSPYTQNYINVISGIEMLQYFKHTHNIFTTSIFAILDEKNTFFLLFFFTFTISCVLNLLKLIHEMNLKFEIFTHTCILIHEIINFSIIIFVTFYITASKNSKQEADLVIEKQSIIYHDFLSLISIHSYIILMISIAILFYPFRLISFLSWFKIKTKYLVSYLNVIFRMLPGILIVSLTVVAFLISYSLMLYILYSEFFYEYSSLLSTCMNIFNMPMIIYHFTSSGKLAHNLNLSIYYIFFNVIVLVALFAIVLILIATFSYLFKKASVYEVKIEDDEVTKKLDDLTNKIDSIYSSKEEIFSSDNTLIKRIILLNLTKYSEIYANKFDDGLKVVLFNSSKQIIAFFKYLFSIKPKMQFENLDNKFSIFIECKVEIIKMNMMLKEVDLDEIDILLDWLNFTRSRISVIIYTNVRLDETLRMSISSLYWDVLFINSQQELNDYFDLHKSSLEKKKSLTAKNSFLINVLKHQISRGNRFTIYPGYNHNYTEIVEPSKKNSNSKIPVDFLKIVETSDWNKRKHSLKDVTNINQSIRNLNSKKRNTFNTINLIPLRNCSISEETSNEELNYKSFNSGKTHS